MEKHFKKHQLAEASVKCLLQGLLWGYSAVGGTAFWDAPPKSVSSFNFNLGPQYSKLMELLWSVKYGSSLSFINFVVCQAGNVLRSL